MASLLNSQASLEERAKECGLSRAEIDTLIGKGLKFLLTWL